MSERAEGFQATTAGFARKRVDQLMTRFSRKKDLMLTTAAADVPKLPSSGALRIEVRPKDGRFRDELVLVLAGREVPAGAHLPAHGGDDA